MLELVLAVRQLEKEARETEELRFRKNMEVRLFLDQQKKVRHLGPLAPFMCHALGRSLRTLDLEAVRRGGVHFPLGDGDVVVGWLVQIIEKRREEEAMSKKLGEAQGSALKLQDRDK